VKILVTMNSLQQGGAEKSALKLATGLASDGHEVCVYPWNNEKDFFEIPSGVTRVHPSRRFSTILRKLEGLPDGLRHRINGIFHIAGFRKHVITSGYEVVIAFESNIGSVVAISLMSSGVPLVVSERISPNSKVHQSSTYAQRLRPWIYRKGVICSVQSRGFQSWVSENWQIDSIVTPNHVSDDWLEPEELVAREKKVIALGRFDDQKDFRSLIVAWSLIEDELPNWRLEIHGRGDITSHYFQMRGLGLKNLHFYPATNKSKEIISSASILVSSSKYEGFPNVVLEALARLTPTVSTKSSDVISDFESEQSLIAVSTEDPGQLANAILRVATNPTLQTELGLKGYAVASRFTWEGVRNTWYSAISSAQIRGGIKLIRRRGF